MTLEPHIPVLLAPILTRAAPIRGVWLDGTFGAGGYTRAILDAGADRVIAIDRDTTVLDEALEWAGKYGDRLRLVEGNFQDLDRIAADLGEVPLAGVVLDIGVSSMQLDRSERGFSFMNDGPLDMRMAQTGATAADLVNTMSEAVLADILFQYGEERASRRIARAIVTDRKTQPFNRTRQLAGLIERVMPRPRPGQPHPATRTFQALRIAVNDELGALARGLLAAERALGEGGILAVVSFHSLEDRIVKRFLRARSGQAEGGSRHMPEAAAPEAARFKLLTRKAVPPEEGETLANPRARSAKLRMAARTDVPAGSVGLDQLGLPPLGLKPIEDHR